MSKRKAAQRTSRRAAYQVRRINRVVIFIRISSDQIIGVGACGGFLNTAAARRAPPGSRCDCCHFEPSHKKFVLISEL